ncbi:MAG: CotH kinase family protein [Alloprevotella sp.]|nr:CotH kinase family protein [Alloprevotella sp.]
MLPINAKERWLVLLLLAALAPRLGAQRQITRLPALYMETLDGSGITSHDVYTYAALTLVEGRDTLRWDSIQVRGRGNSTWVHMDKKSYRLKFPKKVRLLGKERANAKKWNLLANAADKTLIRNALTSELGRIIGLPFNPSARFVDFWLNGTYLGNYQLTDNIDVRPGRVDIHEQENLVRDENTDITGGYLLEVDGFTNVGDIYFWTDKGVHVRIHDPQDSIVQRQIDYISGHVGRFEEALFSEAFTDAERSWRQYVDSATLIGWYLASEISANPDAFWSTYFYKERGDDRFFWGPLWDYDIAYNNTTRMTDTTSRLMRNYSFGWGQAGQWVRQMWKDPWFASTVYYRYRNLYLAGLDNKMLTAVDSLANIVRRSALENYKLWPIDERTYEERVLYSCYDEYIDELRAFIKAHNAYLLRALARLCPDVPPPPFEADDPAACYRIYNLGADDCVLEQAEWATDEGRLVRICDEEEDAAAQLWRIRAVGELFHLTNAESGLALADYYPGDPYFRQLIVCEPDPTDSRQLWRIVPGQKRDSYNLYNAATGCAANNLHTQTRAGNDINNSQPENYDATSPNRLWLFEREVPAEEERIVGIRPIEHTAYALIYHPETHQLRFTTPPDTEKTLTASIYTKDGRLVGKFGVDNPFDTSALPTDTYIVTWDSEGTQKSIKVLLR